MAGPFKVRLEDGMEVGPLDGEMLRSWFQQGLIARDTQIRAKGTKRWVRLGDTFDISDWGASPSAGGGGGGRGRPAPEDLAGLEDDDPLDEGGPQTWRTYVACAVFFVLAVGSGYFSLFPDQWRMPAHPPWREIALGFVVLGLMLVRGWEAMRKVVRVLVLILTLGLFPLAEVLVFHGVPWRTLVVLLPAVVMGFGLFFFLSPRNKPWPRVALNLLGIAAGIAGVVFLGAFPPPAVADWMAAPSELPAALAPAMRTAPRAHPTLAPPPAGAEVAANASASTPVPATPAAATPVPAASPTPAAADVDSAAPSVAAVMQEVPLLSPAASEAVRRRAVFAPEDAFRRSYEMAGNGVAALAAAERRDLGELMAVAYGNIAAADRRRLEAYMNGIRGGQVSTTELNREMSGLMRAAVLKLPDAQRARLQALYEKAVLAAR